MELVNRDQIRGARAMLGWSQQHLAAQAGVSLPSVKRLETGREQLSAHTSTLAKVQNTLEKNGIVFIFKRQLTGVGKRRRDEP